MKPSSILALALLLPLLSSPALGAPADDPRPVVPASEILAKIERGEPVEYDGVIVEGDLDLSEVKLPTINRTVFEIDILGLTEVAKIIESSISIRNSEIRGIVNFSGAQFSGYAGFWGVKFSGDAYFREAEFSGYADFYEAEFSGYAGFWGG